MGAIICQYQEQLKTRFLPLDDNFLVLIIFAAYSTFVSLCTHRRTMLKAPLREIYGKQKLNRHRKKRFSRLQKIRTFPTLLSVHKSRGKVVLRPAKNCPPCLKSTLLLLFSSMIERLFQSTSRDSPIRQLGCLFVFCQFSIPLRGVNQSFQIMTYNRNSKQMEEYSVKIDRKIKPLLRS